MDQKIFSQRLAEMRARRGLSKVALARRVGITDVYLGDLEIRGKTPSLTVAGKLADALGVTVDWLCGRDDSSPETTSANGTTDLALPAVPAYDGRTGPAEAGKGERQGVTTPPDSFDPWRLAQTLAEAWKAREETDRIRIEEHAKSERLRLENERLRIERVDALAQENLHQILLRLEGAADPHRVSRPPEGATATGGATS